MYIIHGINVCELYFVCLISLIIIYLNVLPFKKLPFLRIGLQMFKYEYGQLPDALNIFFVKNRSVHNYNTRNKDKVRPAIAKHVYRDRDFRLVGVRVWNYICDNINIDAPFASFERILKKLILSEFFIIYLI